MEAQELNFSATLEKMLGVSKEEIEKIIERLDVDELSNLIDACGKNDITTVKSIVGVTDEEDESADKSEKQEDTKDALRGLILRKDDAKKVKSKKHKLQKKELGEEDDTAAVFSLGDEVLVDGEEATVKIPQAPGGTVGVMINGELKMVDKKTSNITKVEEGVLGMTQMPGLTRIKELAGMGRGEPAPLDFNEPAPEGPLPSPEADMTDPVDAEFEPVAGPDLGGSDEVGGMGGLGADTGMDMGGDMGADMAPEVPALPAPAPAMPPMAAPAPDMSSAGMANIGSALEDAAALDNAISEIEHMIPNCKISEYKTLVQRLEGLVAMAKSAGKAALVESAKYEEKKRKHRAVKGSAVRFDSKDVDDYLMGDHKGDDDIAQFKGRSKFEEGKLKPKTEDALDTDGDAKAEKEETKNERKTLLDYVKEAEETEMTLGTNPNDAMKALQARMGPKATPQDARKAFDALRASKVVDQKGSAFTMAAMGDDDLNSAINAPAPDTVKKTMPNKTSYQPSTSKQSNPAGGGNGYQGQ